jgi:YggT family protein
MNSLLVLFNQIVELYIWVLIINAVASWLVAFNVINTSNRFVYIVLETTYKLTNPALRFIKNYIPNLGSIDISPVILVLGLIFVKNFVNEIFYKAVF